MTNAAEFFEPPTNYKVEGSAESSYLKAKQEWDERIGSTVVQAKNWRLVAVICAAISAISVLALIYEAQKPKHIPMIVTVDRATGAPIVHGELIKTVHQPTLPEIKYFLVTVLKKVRGVSLDPVIVRRSWEEALFYFNSKAGRKLTELTYKDEKAAINHVGERTQTVDLISINQIGGGNSYQLRWKETIFGVDGSIIDAYSVTGVFTIEFELPTKREEILVNPLGLYIVDLEWTRDYKTGD